MLKHEMLCLRLLRLVAAMALVTGCASPAPRRPISTISTPSPGASCFTVFETTLAECKALAVAGNAGAAVKVGDYYARPTTARVDHREALYWYERGAELGDATGLRKLFDAYHFGWEAPKNTEKANYYLVRAANTRAEWAQLIVAKRAEKNDPDAALRLYTELARKDNCYAQAKLARAYFEGNIAPRNPTQAYFWFLLARVGPVTREFSGHPLLRDEGQGYPYSSSCLVMGGTLSLPHNFERELPETLIRMAQNAATSWRSGEKEPILPSPSVGIGPHVPDRKPPGPPLPPSRKEQPAQRDGARTATVSLPKWTPLQAAQRLLPIDAAKDGAALFEMASRSVWLLVAASAEADSGKAVGLALGSAVAINRDLLLTNCHVVDGRPVVWIKQGDTIAKAHVAVADTATDRCVLSTELATLVPVVGMRAYDTLKVGEGVYTIGSPRGLERSLGHGIISGLRRVDEQRLVQTTAHISPGSSGGGLFDQSGNLIAVTTFKLRESEGLNFAIAVEEYFK